MLKYITNITIKLTPYSPKSGSARCFLNHVYTDSAMSSNPDCKIKSVVQSDLSLKNSVFIQFKDGHKLDLKADNLKAKDIVEAMSKYSRKLALADESK